MNHHLKVINWVFFCIFCCLYHNIGWRHLSFDNFIIKFYKWNNWCLERMCLAKIIAPIIKLIWLQSYVLKSLFPTDFPRNPPEGHLRESTASCAFFHFCSFQIYAAFQAYVWLTMVPGWECKSRTVPFNLSCMVEWQLVRPRPFEETLERTIQMSVLSWWAFKNWPPGEKQKHEFVAFPYVRGFLHLTNVRPTGWEDSEIFLFFYLLIDTLIPYVGCCE